MVKRSRICIALVVIVVSIPFIFHLYFGVGVIQEKIITKVGTIKYNILPSFSNRYHEFIFSAIIEKTFHNSAYLTIFMLSHHMLDVEDSMGHVDVHIDKQSDWKAAAQLFRNTSYSLIGTRELTSESLFYVHILLTESSLPRLSQCRSVPNRLTSDANSNRRLDILRCPIILDVGQKFFNQMDAKLGVSLWSADGLLVSFQVPWHSRRTGWLLDSPSKIHGLYVTTLNSWKRTPSADQNPRPVVHLCVPAIAQLPSQKSLALMLEFVSHHLLIGFDHIYLPVPVLWTSIHMKRILVAFQTYILEGKVTVISQAGDGLDGLYSAGGLSWSAHAVKLFQTNMILYYCKGLADYLAIFDLDEFFIPKFWYSRIQDILIAVSFKDAGSMKASQNKSLAEVRPEQWTRGAGWADGEAHPFCYLNIQSSVIARRKATNSRSQQEVLELESPWMGERFAHGKESHALGSSADRTRHAYSRAILPTRTIFQAGINMGGACALEHHWTSCASQSLLDKTTGQAHDLFCGLDSSNDPRRDRKLPSGEYVDFRVNHDFSDVVLVADSKTLNPKSEGEIYHFLLHRDILTAHPKTAYVKNHYAKYFFKNVLQDLQQRGLELLVTLPHHLKLKSIQQPSSSWVKLVSPVVRKTQFTADNNTFPPLANNFSDRSIQNLVNLPNFAVDFSEYALGALIERESESWNLYLTTFFLCHDFLFPKEGSSAAGGEKIDPASQHAWKTAMNIFETTQYSAGGTRMPAEPYVCRITHFHGVNNSKNASISYDVGGHFVPNRLTPDSNGNRRMDIFRCKLQNSQAVYHSLLSHDPRLLERSMHVEILRGNMTLISFLVPWKTRVSGYLLDWHVPVSTVVNPWQGYNNLSHPRTWTHDSIYMCVPGLDSSLDKISVALYLEFIQHHILLGVKHIFVSVLFSWNSSQMKLLIRVFRQYIDEGFLTISSQCGDGYDFTYSSGGLLFSRDNVKIFHVNMCLYFAKGMANYVGIWDFDEFIIPLGENLNIMDVINQNDRPLQLADAGDVTVKVNDGDRTGLADGENHPLCYMLLNSLVILYPKEHEDISVSQPWIGVHFAHGAEQTGAASEHGLAFKKSIRPTRTVFEGGLHMAGACRLPRAWSGCCSPTTNNTIHGLETTLDGFCYLNDPDHTSRFNNNAIMSHAFDDNVMDGDAKAISSMHGAVVHHFQHHRFWFGASQGALQSQNDYTKRYFPAVIRELDRRGLFEPIALDIIKKPQRLDNHLMNWNNIIKDHSSAGPPLAHSLLDKSVELPSFSFDFSELILSSFLELKPSLRLSITTFLLSTSLFNNMIHRTAQQLYVTEAESVKWSHTWQAMKSARDNQTSSCYSEYQCLVHLPQLSERVLEGTLYSTANSVHNALECIINFDISSSLIHANANISVDILKCGKPITRFNIPLRGRVQSKQFRPITSPPWKSSSVMTAPIRQLPSSTLDMWERQSAANISFHLCVSDVRAFPSKLTVAALLEFVQHHLNIGVAHIWLGVAFPWSSVAMRKYLRIFNSYILDGLITVSSHSDVSMVNDDDSGHHYSAAAVQWSRHLARKLHVQSCMRLANGIASHIGLWSLNNFLIPHTSFSHHSVNILNTIAALRAWDKSTAVVFHVESLVSSTRLSAQRGDRAWLGLHFLNASQDSDNCLADLRIIYDSPNFFDSLDKPLIIKLTDQIESYATVQVDCSVAVIYEFKYDHTSQPIEDARLCLNEYCKSYYKQAMMQLEKRNLDILVNVPDKSNHNPNDRVDNYWLNYDDVYASRRSSLL